MSNPLDNVFNMGNVMRDMERERMNDLLRASAPPKNYNLASEFHKRLISWINDYDAALDQDHEVGVRLVSFGQTVVFHLNDISYWNPSLISFIGVTNEGEPVELIQHVSQISVLLMKLPRLDKNKPKAKIGFRADASETVDDEE